MMKVLNERGVAAFEFCLIAVPIFMFILAMFDLGRYAITIQSLNVLANAQARAIMIGCYTNAKVQSTSPSACTSDPLTDTQKKALAPYLYGAGQKPTTLISSANSGTSPLTVTTSKSFTMLMPIWGWPSGGKIVSASTTLPF
jgi:Flp pilus assembly protein TadG